MPATVKRRSAHVIERPQAIRVLASPLRQAIVDAVAADGPLSVAELSGVFHRPADRLYYHVKRLVAAGLLVPAPAAGSREARFDVAGRPMFIRYAPREAANRRAVLGVIDGMLRAARRDFTRGFRAGVEAEGPRRRLWASRVEGTLTAAEMERLNRLLTRTIALVMSGRGRSAAGARPHQLTWVSSPARTR